jgi:hypothetical protein
MCTNMNTVEGLKTCSFSTCVEELSNRLGTLRNSVLQQFTRSPWRVRQTVVWISLDEMVNLLE